MSEATNDGGNAFPCDPFIASRPGTEAVAKRMAEGMSLRDYFAAKAMPAILADPRNLGYVEVAECCYTMADAMIRARDGGAA